MDAPSIIPATEDDIETIRRLARRIWLDHYPGIITHRQIEYMLDRDYSAAALRRDINEDITIDLLALAGKISGFAAYGPAACAAHAKLHKLYLDTVFHGRGYGSTLIRHVIGECRRRGFKRLTLQVNKHNRKAIDAYERAGFAREASILDDIGEGFFMDDYVMGIDP